MKNKLQRRVRRHERSKKEEALKVLRNSVEDKSGAKTPLGSRIAARFAHKGLTKDIPELRDQPAQPVDFES